LCRRREAEDRSMTLVQNRLGASGRGSYPAADLHIGPRAAGGREPVINVNRKRPKDFSTVHLHWPACLLV
jgi:hypothetical protein